MNLKKRIAVFLCLLLVLPTLLQSLPGLTLEANAASNNRLNTSLSWSVYTRIGEDNYSYYGTQDLILEVGQEIDFSSYFYWYNSSNYSSNYLRDVSGEKYSSSNKNVASISKAGVLTAKKEGTTKISVKFKNQGIKVNIKVTAKKYTKNKKIASLNSTIDKAWKKYGKKNITAKNVTALYNEVVKIRKTALECNKVLNNTNSYPAILSSTVSIKQGNEGYYYNYYVLINYGKYNQLTQKLYEFTASKKNSIVATISTKNLTAKSVKVSGKKLTVNLNKKLTIAHLTTVAYFGSMDSQITSKSGLKINYSIYKGNGLKVTTFDTKGKEVMTGTVTLKPGNKTIAIKMKKKLAKGNYYVAFYNGYKGYALSCSKAFKVK